MPVSSWLGGIAMMLLLHFILLPRFDPWVGLGTRALSPDEMLLVRLLLAENEQQVLGAGRRGCLQGNRRLLGPAPWPPWGFLSPIWKVLLWPAPGGLKAGTSQKRSCHFPANQPSVQETGHVLVSFHFPETYLGSDTGLSHLFSRQKAPPYSAHLLK